MSCPRLAELEALVPNASDAFLLRALRDDLDDNQVVIAYVDANCSRRTRYDIDDRDRPTLPTPTTELTSESWVWPIIRLVFLLMVVWLAFVICFGATVYVWNNYIDVAPAPVPTPDPVVPTVTIDLPSYAQPIYVALQQSKPVAQEASNLFASMAEVQSGREELVVGDLQKWMAGIGPKFTGMNPGLKPVGLDQPMMDSLRQLTGAKLYETTVIPEPVNWFAAMSDSGMASVNGYQVNWR